MTPADAVDALVALLDGRPPVTVVGVDGDAAERLWCTSVRLPETFDLVVRGTGSADGA